MHTSRFTSLALAFCLGAQSIAAQQRDSSGPATLAAVERGIRERADADSFSGAVLVPRHCKPVLRGGYGLADRENRRPIDADTKFNLRLDSLRRDSRLMLKRKTVTPAGTRVDTLIDTSGDSGPR